MRWNDPHFLAKRAVEKLINSVDVDTRLAMVIFDVDTRLEVPLTFADAAGKRILLASLDKLDYRGPWTDIPGESPRV